MRRMRFLCYKLRVITTNVLESRSIRCIRILINKNLDSDGLVNRFSKGHGHLKRCKIFSSIKIGLIIERDIQLRITIHSKFCCIGLGRLQRAEIFVYIAAYDFSKT